MKEAFDLIVIGGGRAAGLAYATSKAGWKTALIERDSLGGTCPNRGCVPSKLLIGFAEASRRVKEAERHFIDAEWRGVDLRRVFNSVNDYISQVDARYETRGTSAGTEIIRGAGRFTAPKVVAVGDREITAERIVVATGSRPVAPPYADLPVWTSDDLFPLKGNPPDRLIMIGGGVIGVEMAAFFSGVGSKVTLFARDARLLGREDSDIEAVFQREFAREVGVHCHASLTDLTHDGAKFTATFRIQDQETRSFTADRVLFAIGRCPNTEALDLEKTGLKANERGFLPVNDHLETAVPGIYAMGDVNGRFMLQHAASYEAFYLRRKFLKNNTDPIDEGLVAHAIYAHPEVAGIGLTEQQLEKDRRPYVSVIEDWSASARADAMRIDYPRVKMLVSPENHRILGCHLVGPEASTLLHQVMTVMRLKNDIRELADMIYIHPALNECLLSAAVKVVGKINAWRSRDDPSC